MSAQQLNVEVIANNIANSNTTAFKRNKAEFADLYIRPSAKPAYQIVQAESRFQRACKLGLECSPLRSVV